MKFFAKLKEWFIRRQQLNNAYKEAYFKYRLANIDREAEIDYEKRLEAKARSPTTPALFSSSGSGLDSQQPGAAHSSSAHGYGSPIEPDTRKLEVDTRGLD
jgi:hypothetical protein